MNKEVLIIELKATQLIMEEAQVNDQDLDRMYQLGQDLILLSVWNRSSKSPHNELLKAYHNMNDRIRLAKQKGGE